MIYHVRQARLTDDSAYRAVGYFYGVVPKTRSFIAGIVGAARCAFVGGNVSNAYRVVNVNEYSRLVGGRARYFTLAPRTCRYLRGIVTVGEMRPYHASGSDFFAAVRRHLFAYRFNETVCENQAD